jgi:hypothetical protein
MDRIETYFIRQEITKVLPNNNLYVADMYIPQARKISIHEENTKLKIGEKISVMSTTGRKLSYGSITYVGKGKSKVLIHGRKKEEWQPNDTITKICQFCDLPIPFKLLDEKGEHMSCYYATQAGQFLRAAKLGDIDTCKKICEQSPDTFRTTDPDGSLLLNKLT